MITRQGWICTRCNASLSPDVTQCACTVTAAPPVSPWPQPQIVPVIVPHVVPYISPYRPLITPGIGWPYYTVTNNTIHTSGYQQVLS